MSDELNKKEDVIDTSDFNIDEFLPIPGAESVVTGTDDVKKVANVFATNQDPDFSFLDKKEEETKDPEIEDALALEQPEEVIEKNPGRPKTEKSGLVNFFKKKIESGEMFAFDDYKEDQPLDEYLGSLSEKDLEELYDANINHLKEDIAAKTPQEFFESLPGELQYAAEYVANGGKDLKGLFKALAYVEETRELDVTVPEHQEAIVRQYLQATNFGNGDSELIEDQVQEWIDAGTISKKANQFKPKLDDLQEELIQVKIAEQAENKRLQQEKKKAYMDNIYNTLKPGEINGMKIDSKRQKFLWDELTTTKYQSITGRPTNLLGKLLEDYQFSNEPRYDLIAEVTWLLSDPEDYKNNIKRQAANAEVDKTARSLKTAEAQKIASHVTDNDETKQNSRKTLTRTQTNIFKR